jgi:RND superfamily putative drug exporter
MQMTLERSSSTLLTSAGTVIVGLSLMGTTRFKLFSSTGPSVAIALAITLVAALTLTPAILIITARLRPRCFRGLTAPSSGLWERVARVALARPIVSGSSGPCLSGAATGCSSDPEGGVSDRCRRWLRPGSPTARGPSRP